MKTFIFNIKNDSILGQPTSYFVTISIKTKFLISASTFTGLREQYLMSYKGS